MKKRQMRKKKRRMKENAIKNKNSNQKIKIGSLVEYNGSKRIVKSITAGILQLDNGFCVDETKVKLI